jgi:hypothetical protein
MQKQLVQHSSSEKTQNTRETASISLEDLANSHVKTLREDARGLEGELLKAGTKVLYSPLEENAFREDTPENRKLFARLGYAWTEATRSTLWFPPITATLQSELEGVGVRCQEFMNALDENLHGAKGKPLPDTHLSLAARLLPWRSRVQNVTSRDLSREFVRFLLLQGDIPAETPCPETWLKTLERINAFRVYSLEGFGGIFHVIAAFCSPLTFNPSGAPALGSPEMRHEDMIQEFYRQKAPGDMPKPSFIFYSLGSSRPWLHRTEGSANSSYWLQIAQPHPQKRWEILLPPRKTNRIFFNDFVRRLAPLTEQEKLFRVEAFIKEHLQEQYGGNLSVEKIAKKLGFHKREVLTAFEELQKGGEYQCYKDDGMIVIVPKNVPRAGKKIRISSLDLRQKLKSVSLGVAGTAIALGAENIGFRVMGDSLWSSFLLVPLFAYLGGCLGKYLAGKE